MVNCPHPYDLQSYADGALGDAERQSVATHLGLCPACADRAAALSRLHGLLAGRRAEPAPGLLERILELLRSVVPVRKLGCSEALEMASAYLDDELNQAERETLEAHLFACESCYYEYVAMREAAEAMRATPRVAASADLKARIMAAIAQESPAPVSVPRAGFSWRRALVPGMALAAVALLGFVALHLNSARPGQPATTVASAPGVATSPRPEASPVPAVTSPSTPAPAVEPSVAPAPSAAVPEAEPAAGGVPPRVPEPSEPAAMPRSTSPFARLASAIRPAPAPAPRAPVMVRQPASAPTAVRPAPAATRPGSAPAVPAPRGPSRLVPGTRTPAPATRLAIVPDGGWGAAPAVAPDRQGGAGVFASRTLAPAVPTTLRPTMVATVRERPAAPRAAVAEKPAPGPAETDRGEERVALRTWVPRVAEDRTTVYTGPHSGSGDFRARAERINARAHDERMFLDGETALD
jgi:anti-sigma factor RsiW